LLRTNLERNKVKEKREANQPSIFPEQQLDERGNRSHHKWRDIHPAAGEEEAGPKWQQPAVELTW